MNKFISFLVLFCIIKQFQSLSSKLKVDQKEILDKVQHMQMTGEGIVLNKPYIYEHQDTILHQNGIGKTKSLRKHQSSFIQLTNQMKTRTYLNMDPVPVDNMHYSEEEAYPSGYFMDFCAEALEGNNIDIKCNEQKCKGGKISSIPYANYGASYGTCPNYWATFRCVKEINPYVLEECDDEPDCSFMVQSEEYTEYPWTTQWGMYWFVLGCAGIQLKLQVVASCKCDPLATPESALDKQKRKEAAEIRQAKRNTKYPCQDGQKIQFYARGYYLGGTKEKKVQFAYNKAKGDDVIWTCVKQAQGKYAYKSNTGLYLRALKSKYIDLSPKIGDWEKWGFKKVEDDVFIIISSQKPQTCMYGSDKLVLQSNSLGYEGCQMEIRNPA